MTTLVLTPTVDGVQLVVSGVEPVTVARLDANGYRSVRRPATAPTSWTDYEAAMAGSVRYVAIDAGGLAAYATAVAISAGPQLRRVFVPSKVVVPTVARLDAARPLRYSRHEVIGRADAVFTTYRMGLRAGTLTLTVPDYAGVVAVRDLYADGSPVMLRMPDYKGLDAYHVATAITEAPGEEQRADDGRDWTLTVAFEEVQPSGLTTLVGWTLADVAATFPNLGAAALAYATLGDMDADARAVA